jgi:hypothetical protein
VLHTCEAAIPNLLRQADGGSIVITSAMAALTGMIRELGTQDDGFLG